MKQPSSSAFSPAQTYWIVIMLYLADLLGSFLLGYFEWSWLGWLLILLGLLTSSLWGTRLLLHQLRRPARPRLTLDLQTKVLDAIRDAVVVIDEKGCILYANPAFQHLSGFMPHELNGQPVISLLPAWQSLDLGPYLERVKVGEPVKADWQIVRKDQSVIDIVSTAHLLVDQETQEPYFLGIVRDVTELKASQAALEAEKQQFEFFVESLPHLMWIHAEQGQIEFVNRRARELLQTSPERDPELLDDLHWQGLFHPQDQAWVTARLEQARAEGSSCTLDARLQHVATGSYQWFRLHITPMLSPEGEVLRWYGTGTDIDELMHTREQLRDKERLYRSLVESQGTFVMRLDQAGHYLYANPALVERFFPDHRITDKRALTFIHPDDREAVDALGLQCLDQLGVRRDLIARKRLPDDSYLPIAWEFICLRDEQTGAVFFQAIGHDISQQVAIQATLEAEKQKFKFFVESLPLLMWTFSPEGGVDYLNRYGRERFVRTSPDALAPSGQAWLRYLHPEDRQRISQVFANLNEAPRPYQLDARLWQETEQVYRWYRLQGVPLLDARGQVDTWFNIGTDIDTLRRTQEQLDDRERFFRSLVESAETFVMRADLEGRYLYLNPAMARKFYPGQTLPASHVNALVHPEDLPQLEEVSTRCLAAPGTCQSLICRKRLPNGTWAYTEWEFVCFQDGDQTFFQGIGGDITQRYQLEQERLNLIRVVEQTDHGVTILAPDSTITWVNQAQERITGYQRHEMIERNPVDLFIGPMTEEAHIEQVREAVQRGLPLTLELIKYTKAGTPYWAELFIQPDRGIDGHLLQSFVLECDITIRNLRRQDLERTATELRRQNERLNEFAYLVSHNVRAPLANLKGMGDLLMEEIDPSPSNQSVRDFFRKAVDRLEEVISGMQHALEVEQLSEEQREVNLLEVFQHICDQLQLDLSAVGIRWHIDFSHAPTLRAPWTYLHNILYNLISNAVKYRHPDRPLEIELSSYRADGQLIVLVRDNGRGMDLDQVGEQLFERGARFHRDVDGTGTGLYLVRKHMDHMGGRIEVESAPDQGTAFWLFWPD